MKPRSREQQRTSGLVRNAIKPAMSLAIACSLLSLTCLASVAQEEQTPSSLRLKNYRPQVGELHMDFTLPRLSDGSPVSLSDFRGKKVLLIQFASW